MKKFIFSFCTIFFIFILTLSYCETPSFDIYSNSAVLIDARTGKILFEKNSSQKAYPASTTKVLTAYIALSQGFSMDKQIIPSKNSVMSVPRGSSIAYFSENEQLTLEQVLYGLLLPSGNDAANILAESISGSNSEFAKLMNETALSLGATNSHFTNPSGLHDDEHYTTASDLAKIAQQAMKIEKFREIVSQSRYNMPPTNVSSVVRPFSNTNKLLNSGGEYFYQLANGIKTGFTTEAGNCLVASASKEGVELITVVLGGNIIPVGKSAIYLDTLNLFNFGFENYHNQQVIPKSTTITSVIPKRSGKKTLDLITDSDINYLVENGDTPIFHQIVTLDKDISAPISANDILGTVSYSLNGEIIGISNLIAKTTVLKEAWYQIALKILIIFIFSVIMLGVSLRLFNDIRKNIRRKKRNKRNLL